MTVDPVCKKEVDEEMTEFTSVYRDKKYYFCALGCKEAFDKVPEKYLGGRIRKGCGCGCR